jgi:hypothetical protein
MALFMRGTPGMNGGMCEYCTGSADQSIGGLWLCDRHESELEQEAGGLALLLEMAPEARRALADAYLPLLVREDVQEPSDVYEP